MLFCRRGTLFFFLSLLFLNSFNKKKIIREKKASVKLKCNGVQSKCNTVNSSKQTNKQKR